MKKKKNESVLVKFIENCTDFSNFKFLKGTNRNVSESHVNELVESFLKFGSASATVIVVKTKSINGIEEYYYADGQHTVLAVQRLGIGVDVKIVELVNDTKLNITKYIAILNNTSLSWSSKIYLNSFMDNNIREYTIMNELRAKTGLTMTDLLFIFVGTNSRKDFTNGEMVFVNEADSMELLDAVMSVKNLIPNKAFVRRSLYKIMRVCKDYKRMAKAITKTAEALKTAHTKFSESETEFYDHLVKIYKSEFNIK
jgi:hypothetical protein